MGNEVNPDLLNKSLEEIKQQYYRLLSSDDNVRKMIRNRMSLLLMDTSEESKMEVNICVDDEEAFGLSSNCMPHIKSIWQEPSEGWLTFDFEGDYSMDFDEFTTRELIGILEDLEWQLDNAGHTVVGYNMIP